MGEAEKERVITEEDYGMEEEKDGEFHSHSQTQTQQQPNTSLAELNMLLVFLSLIYISTDECIEEGEGEEDEDKESTHIRREREQVPVAKACTLSRIQDREMILSLAGDPFHQDFKLPLETPGMEEKCEEKYRSTCTWRGLHLYNELRLQRTVRKTFASAFVHIRTGTPTPSVLEAIDHKMDEGDREVLYLGYGNGSLLALFSRFISCAHKKSP
ncbi:uncharacterized protein DS421_4g122610 [Arachis hypogaea]|nr:uncharacterized protein DS421_4g122610 [Arachis hypogaea]